VDIEPGEPRWRPDRIKVKKFSVVQEKEDSGFPGDFNSFVDI
jgi:hypothetical protein